MLGAAAIGALLTFGAWFSPTLTDEPQLVRSPPVGSYIGLTCERLDAAPDIPPRRPDETVAACILGSHRLILAGNTIPRDTTHLEGTLLRRQDAVWSWQGAGTDSATLPLYLVLHDRSTSRAWALAFAGLALFTLALGAFWTATSRSSLIAAK
jgi:hypothetical protein